MNDHEITKWMRIFFLITAIIFCVAGTAVGVTALSEKSKQSKDRQQPVHIEEFADRDWKSFVGIER